MMSLMSSPTSGTGQRAKGPLTVLQFENVVGSLYTDIASSYPVTMTAPWCGSRHTGPCERRCSKNG